MCVGENEKEEIKEGKKGRREARELGKKEEIKIGKKGRRQRIKEKEREKSRKKGRKRN